MTDQEFLKTVHMSKLTKLTLILVILLTLPACGGGFKKHTPQQVVDAFKAAGLEAENARAMTKDDYGLAPMADEGLRILLPSLCEDCGGRVMSYASAKERDKAQTFYDQLGKESAILFSWTFARDNILVQLNGDLPEDQAKKYEAALNGL